jgi:hypothetical protein
MTDGQMNWGPWVDSDEHFPGHEKAVTPEQQKAEHEQTLQAVRNALDNPSLVEWLDNSPEPDDPSSNWSELDNFDEDEDGKMTPEELAHHRIYYPADGQDPEHAEALELLIKRKINAQGRA